MVYTLRTNRALQGGKEKEECFRQLQVHYINTEVQKSMVCLENYGRWPSMPRMAVHLSEPGGKERG